MQNIFQVRIHKILHFQSWLHNQPVNIMHGDRRLAVTMEGGVAVSTNELSLIFKIQKILYYYPLPHKKIQDFISQRKSLNHSKFQILRNLFDGSQISKYRGKSYRTF